MSAGKNSNSFYLAWRKDGGRYILMKLERAVSFWCEKAHHRNDDNSTHPFALSSQIDVNIRYILMLMFIFESHFKLTFYPYWKNGPPFSQISNNCRRDGKNDNCQMYKWLKFHWNLIIVNLFSAIYAKLSYKSPNAIFSGRDTTLQ